MDEQAKNKKTAAIVGIAALAVITVLIVVFLNSVEKSKHEGITLPESSSVDTPSEDKVPAEPEHVFATISRENVQKILTSLSRPDFYHQTFKLTTCADDLLREQTAELWVANEKMLVRTVDAFESKTYLTDGQTLYIWYGDSDSVTQIALNEETQPEELTGIPTYRSILSLSAAQIQDAEYLTLPDMDELPCVFVQSDQAHDQHCYWVSLDSGLLYRYTAMADSNVYYTVQQTALELLMDGDEALDGIFLLPDGSSLSSAPSENETESE